MDVPRATEPLREMFAAARKHLCKNKHVLVVLLLLLAGCVAQEPYTKDGKEYGVTKGTFRGRWWSYYERGSSFLSGEFYNEAEADFLRALQGRSRDSWSARTYGLHFVEYFPNRELGVTYYHMGRLDDAENYLRISLSQIDTERARRYLDRVIEKRIERGQILDASDPALHLAQGDQPQIAVADRQVKLDIAAADDVGLKSVSVDGQPLRFRGNEKEARFVQEALFDEGDHVLHLSATDLAGKSSDRQIQLAVDLTGPSIAIVEPALPLVTEDAFVALKGAIIDPSGIKSLQLNDKPLTLEMGGQVVHFEERLPLNVGENIFILKAQDTVGNDTAAAIEIYRGNPGSWHARLWRYEKKYGTQLKIASTSIPALKDIIANAENAPEKPVEISIQYPKDTSEEYRKSELRLAGRVDAQNGLKQLTIREKNVPLLEGAKRVEFRRRLPITLGENTIAVTAEDSQGLREEWQSVIKGAPVLLDEYRMKIAVQHFKGVEPPDNDYLRMTLDGLLLERNRFEVVTRAELENVLDELQLGSSELADPRFALRLGRIKPVDVMLYGMVFPRNDGSAELLCQAIDTETALILSQYDTVISAANDPESRKEALRYLSGWLVEQFPRISGELVAVVGTNAWTNLGKEEGVRKGMKVVVTYEAKPPQRDPATGEILESPIYDALGWAPVVGVENERSKLDKIRFNEGHETSSLHEGQPIFTM